GPSSADLDAGNQSQALHAGTLSGGDAGAGRHRPAELEQPLLDHAEASQDLVERDRAQVADPEDLAGQPALAPGNDELAALELGVERLPVEVVREVHAGHGLGCVSRLREQVEAQRV